MSPRISSPTVVQREAELASLGAVLEGAAAEAPALAVLAGEAGIGKTRLVGELEVQARERGFVVLRGECVQLDGGEVPYGPLSAALRHARPDALERALAQLPARVQAELAGAFPQLWAGDEPSPPDGFAQTRLFESLLRLLEAMSAEAPVLLTLEDFHWVDRSTRDFVRVLSRGLHRERLAAVITYRTGELGPEHPVRELVGELRTLQRTTWIDVSALTPDGMAAQLEGILGTAPAELVAEVHQRSAGNPFFAEELVATWREHRTATAPSSLLDVLLVRMRRLPAPAQELLRVLAAGGRPLPSDVAGAVAGIDEPELSRALREALDRHLLDYFRADGTFAFRHDVVREAVYSDLLPGERAGLHADLAAALAQGIAPSHAELAFHWRSAGRPAQALRESVAAGREAERARASAEALRHFEDALALWDHGAGTDASEDDRLDVLARASDLARVTGASERAVALCEEALARLDAAGDPERAAALYERLGRLRSFREDCGLGAYQAALRWLPPGRPATRARLLTAEGYAFWGQMRWEEAIARCEEALAVATEAEAIAEAAYAGMVLGLAVGHAGDPERAELHLRDALRVPADRLREEDLLYGHLFLGEVLRLRGDFAAAAAVMTDGEAHARRLGLTNAFGHFMTVNAALDHLLLGRWDEAQAALAALEGAPLEPWDALIGAQVAGQLLVARGDLEAGEAELERSRALCEGAPPECLPAVYAGLAELELWRGRRDAAARWVEAGEEALGDRADVLYAPALHAMGARVAADMAAGAASSAVAGQAAARADAWAQRLERVLEAKAVRHRPPTAEGHRATALAEAARAHRRHDPAAWGAAVRAWDAVHAPYAAAYAGWRQAEALLLGGHDRGAATAALTTAQAQAQALGARPLAAEIACLARRARVTLPDEATSPPPAAEEPAGGSPLRERGLTDRELEVLALLGEGFTNRQIGERLFISPKTAGLHVSHILAKLDVDNRTQAADVAHRHGLVAGAGAV